ncbi:MAG: DUF1844 domain-containing protein [Planctomycetia bacterium]|jgi:hypothetical protein
MSDEKKIYVDEDWKSQVEAEREAAQNPVQDEPQGEMPQWPEPSLPLLITTLATQAMVGLGLVEHPLSGRGELDLPQARHFIDTILMLKEKSEGNRTEEETTVIENVLHELQMVYVQIEAAHSGSKPSE